MKHINILSQALAVNNWLANTRQPRILHIFDGACNLVNESRDVLSVVTSQIGNGPFNLVLEDVLFSEHINLQSLVSNSHHQLALGNLNIHTAHATLWNPRPNWEILHRQRGVIFHCTQKIASSRTALLVMTETANYQVPIFPFSNALLSSLVSADLPSSLAAAKQLAGLGMGLTPAGDDFIMGALYAAWIIHPFEVASVLAKEIADTAAPLTTSLSAAWLRSAGNGEAGIIWHEFFDALTSADVVQIQIAMDKILAVGETSGADALAGFIDMFVFYAEREKDHVIPKYLYR